MRVTVIADEGVVAADVEQDCCWAVQRVCEQSGSTRAAEWKREGD